MLGQGNLSKLKLWKDILEGKTMNLKHGYYSVKMPDDKERQEGPTQQEIERRETAFFNNTEPWKDISDRSRLGMRNFVASTSRLLIQVIETK